MSKQTKQWTAWGITAVVLTLLAIFLGVKFPVPPAPTEPVTELGTTHFTAIEAEDFTATDDLVVTDDVAVGGDTTITGAATVAGVTTLANNVENVRAPSVATGSITWTASTGGTGTVATIGDGEVWLVLSLVANVTTNWDCTGDDCTCQFGDGADNNALLDLADAELQAADTEGTGAPAGWQGFMSIDTVGAYFVTAQAPFIYAPSGSAETIDWVCDSTGDDLSAGALTYYLTYVRIK